MMIPSQRFTMFWYHKTITDKRAKKLASLNIPSLDVSMVENLSNAQSRYLSQFKWDIIDLSWVGTITDEQAFFLSHFKWDKLILTGLQYLTDVQAYYLTQFRWSTLILNWLKRISSIQAKCLSYFGWKFLNLWWLTSLTVIQAKYLSEFEWDILYLDRVVDITEWWLAHFLHFWWSCLHIAGIQFEKWKPVITHAKILTSWQARLIANYKYMNRVIFTNPIKLTDAQKLILKNMDYSFSSFNVPLRWYLKYRINDVKENQQKQSELEEIPINIIANKWKSEPIYYSVDEKYTIERPYENNKYSVTKNKEKIASKYNSLFHSLLKKCKVKRNLKEQFMLTDRIFIDRNIIISNLIKYTIFTAVMYATLYVIVNILF